MMKTISLDIETYSSTDITKSGVYRYAESDDFEILLLSYSIDGGDIKTVDLASGDVIPDEIIRALASDEVEHWAYNSSFERICLSAWLRKNSPSLFHGYTDADGTTINYLSPSSWYCDMVLSAYNGLPLSLAGVGAVLKLAERKDDAGKGLIRYFCSPCQPTKANGGRSRNLPGHDAEKWQRFISYNAQDVRTEAEIHSRLSKYPLPAHVWDEYHISEMINDRGIGVDMDLVENAIKLDAASRERLVRELSSLTMLDNPNSVVQMKSWLRDNGIEAGTLGKKAVEGLMKDEDVSDEIRNVLALRLQLAKSSIRKYEAMKNCVCHDGKVHGMFMFYGANRTGRFAGRLVQLQNLPQNHIEDLENARNLVKLGDHDIIEALFDDVPDTLSQLIRTAFIPGKGRKFIVADYSAIEARVIAHLAGEDWRKKVFEENGDIYCASASQMFRVPVVKHGVNGHLRQKGKIAELALGYGGGVGALTAMGALEMGLKEEELQPLVDSWRDANRNITRFWWDVDAAVTDAVRYHARRSVGNIDFCCRNGMLFIELPSGRHLSYVKPRIGKNRFGGESITYEGVDSAKKWDRIESYGPKFVENIVQAVSRDILCLALTNLQNNGFPVSGHVHDEAILSLDMNTDISEITSIMEITPPWLPGIKLKAEGYQCGFYQKS